MKNHFIIFILISTYSFSQSLDQLFQTALNKSHQAKIDGYSDEKTKVLSDQTLGGLLPQVRFSTQSQYNWITTAPFAEGTNAFQFPNGPPALADHLESIQYSWNIHIEQTLNVFRLGTVYEGALQLKHASSLQAELDQESLKLNVAQAYSNVFVAQDEMELNQKLLNSAQTALQGAEIDFKRGAIPRLKLDLVAANNKVAQAELIIAESQLQQALENLTIVVGQEINLNELNPPSEEISKFELSQNLTGENIQIKVLNAYLSYNDNLLSYERSQAAPSFGFIAGVNNNFTHTDNLNPDLWDAPTRYTNPNYFNYYVGIKMQWALYTGGATTAKIKQAEIDNKSQRRQLDKAREELNIQRKQQGLQAQALKNSLSAAQAAYQTNQAYFAQNQLDHKNGFMNYADLLQSERELKESSQRLTRSRTVYLMTLIQLQLLNGQSIGAAQ